MKNVALATGPFYKNPPCMIALQNVEPLFRFKVKGKDTIGVTKLYYQHHTSVT